MNPFNLSFAPLRLCVRPVGVCVAILSLAVLIRGGVLLLMPGALVNDPDGYHRLSENLVAHGTFGVGDSPTAYRPPLYPLLLTGCVALGDYGRVAIGVLHVILGVATVGLVLLLGRWWGLGKRGAALAALLTACDPILLSQSAQVMTETLAALLATAGLVTLTWAGRRPTVCRTMSAGAVLALGALCRPTFLLWTVAAGAALVGMCWWSRHRCRRRLQTPILSGCQKPGSLYEPPSPLAPLPQAGEGSHESATGVASYSCFATFAAFFLGAAVVLGPWAIRNQLQFGRPIVTTTHGGFTLLLANNPEFYEWLRSDQWGSVWRADTFNADWDSRRPRDEVHADRRAYAEAWQTIRQAPGTFAYACLVRVGRFWSPLPHQLTTDESLSRHLSRYAVAVWYALEFVLAAIGAWRIFCLPQPGVKEYETFTPPSAFRLPPSTWLWGLLLVACLTAVHTVFWTDMRMRAPLMPVVALAAAAALCSILCRKKTNALK